MGRKSYVSSALVFMYPALGAVSKAGENLMTSRAGRLTRVVCGAVFPFSFAFLLALLSMSGGGTAGKERGQKRLSS